MGAIPLLRPRSRWVGLVTLEVARGVHNAAPAQEADGERPARGDSVEVLSRCASCSAGARKAPQAAHEGQRRRADRHGVRLRRWAWHDKSHRCARGDETAPVSRIASRSHQRRTSAEDTLLRKGMLCAKVQVLMPRPATTSQPTGQLSLNTAGT